LEVSASENDSKGPLKKEDHGSERGGSMTTENNSLLGENARFLQQKTSNRKWSNSWWRRQSSCTGCGSSSWTRPCTEKKERVKEKKKKKKKRRKKKKKDLEESSVLVNEVMARECSRVAFSSRNLRTDKLK
jgi:hypothetical protein